MGNQITDACLQQLVASKALVAARLESLNLRFNQIGKKGAIALASCKSCAGMKWINLKMNAIGDDGAVAFAEMLKRNTSMTLINLRRQVPALTDKAAVAFGMMFRVNVTLEQLRLQKNKISDNGAASLASAISGRFARQAAAGISKPRLELDLAENKVSCGGVLELLRAVRLAPPCASVEILLSGNAACEDRDALRTYVASLAPHHSRLSQFGFIADPETNGNDGALSYESLDPDDARLIFESKPEEGRRESLL